MTREPQIEVAVKRSPSLLDAAAAGDLSAISALDDAYKKLVPMVRIDEQQGIIFKPDLLDDGEPFFYSIVRTV